MSQCFAWQCYVWVLNPGPHVRWTDALLLNYTHGSNVNNLMCILTYISLYTPTLLCTLQGSVRIKYKQFNVYSCYIHFCKHTYKHTILHLARKYQIHLFGVYLFVCKKSSDDSHDWPQTTYVSHIGLELEIPVLAFPVLELQATPPQSAFSGSFKGARRESLLLLPAYLSIFLHLGTGSSIFFWEINPVFSLAFQFIPCMCAPGISSWQDQRAKESIFLAKVMDLETDMWLNTNHQSLSTFAEATRRGISYWDC